MEVIFLIEGILTQILQLPSEASPKTLEYRTGRKRFVYIFFQASSGIRMEQNKGFLPVLYSKVFAQPVTFKHEGVLW